MYLVFSYIQIFCVFVFLQVYLCVHCFGINFSGFDASCFIYIQGRVGGLVTHPPTENKKDVVEIPGKKTIYLDLICYSIPFFKNKRVNH